MDKKLFRYIEKCLYSYIDNCTKLERLRRELSLLRLRGDVGVQDYKRVAGSGSGSPVFRFVVKLEAMEHKMNRLEQITKPVKELIADLAKNPNSRNPALMNILVSHYFKGLQVKAVMQESHISKSGFYALKYALVRKAMRYFVF